RNISTGKASSAPTNTIVPATTTVVGHAASATTVHHGTPNSSARIVVIVTPTSSGRSDRRIGAAPTASPAVTALPLARGSCSVTRPHDDRPRSPPAPHAPFTNPVDLGQTGDLGWFKGLGHLEPSKISERGGFPVRSTRRGCRGAHGRALIGSWGRARRP